MALDSYAGLKDSVRRWSKRKDAKDEFIADFVTLAEEEIYSNDMSPLRIKEMDTRATAPVSIAERFLALPDGFLEMRRFKINAQTATEPGFTNDRDIRFRAPDQLLLNSISGAPSFFSVTGQLGFDRVPDQLYIVEMQYYAKELPLGDTNASNAILASYPSIYLYGTLWALWQYFSEEEKAEYYHTKMIDAIKGANRAEKRSRYGNAPQIHREQNRP